VNIIIEDVRGFSDSLQKVKVLLPGHFQAICRYITVLRHQWSLQASQHLWTPVAPKMSQMVTMISPGLPVPEASA